MEKTKAGRNRPGRPAGLPLYHFVVQLLGCGPEHIIKQISSARHKYNQSRSKGMYQVYSGPQSVTNRSTRARTDLRSITRPWSNVTRQQWAEDELEPGRPASLRPAGLARGCVGPKQLTPTPREDQRRPREGDGHVTTSLGRTA